MAEANYLRGKKIFIGDLEIQQLLLHYLAKNPKFETRVREIRREEDLVENRNTLIDQAALFKDLASVAKSKGVFGDKAPLGGVIQYANLAGGKRPPRPEMTEEQKAAQKKIPCEMHKQGRCKWGAKCFNSNNQSNNRDRGLGGCPYCKGKDHKLGQCEKFKADEASGGKPPAWWTPRETEDG